MCTVIGKIELNIVPHQECALSSLNDVQQPSSQVLSTWKSCFEHKHSMKERTNLLPVHCLINYWYIQHSRSARSTCLCLVFLCALLSCFVKFQVIVRCQIFHKPPFSRLLRFASNQRWLWKVNWDCKPQRASYKLDCMTWKILQDPYSPLLGQ